MTVALQGLVVGLLVARAVVKCGLGERLGHLVVSAFGRSTLGLGYSVFLVDGVIAPAFRTRQFNQLAGSLDSIGSTTIVKAGKVDIDASYEGDLIAAADQAMYEAKAAGRQRIRIAPPASASASVDDAGAAS